MKIEQITTSDTLYEQALELRYRLFFEGHDLPRGIEKDELETQSTHFVVSDNECLVAYGRLTELSSGHFKISQLVVVPSLQRQGYGTALLNNIIAFVQSNEGSSIELNSQVAATALYKKLGFSEAGAHYPSKTTGVLHVKMVLGTAV